MSPKKNDLDKNLNPESEGKQGKMEKEKTVKKTVRKTAAPKAKKAEKKETAAPLAETAPKKTASAKAAAPAVKALTPEEEKKARMKAALEKIRARKKTTPAAEPQEDKVAKDPPAVQAAPEPPKPEVKEPRKEEPKKPESFETYAIRDGKVVDMPRGQAAHKVHKKAEPVHETKKTAQKPVKAEEGKASLQAPETEETVLDESVSANLKKLQVSSQITVRELSEKMAVRGVDLIKKLMSMGIFATITQRLDPDVASLVAIDYGYDLEIVNLFSDEKVEEQSEVEDPKDLKHRPPVITIMGHVDHGKTTLLDALRESNVVDTEVGQITQHIGAYTIKTEKGHITVLDTPGHEAFTAMRAHGVKVTDIVVLVVSAADGVMPQTVEAINHAKAANAPIIVAINKMDLPTANAQNIKQQLSGYDLLPEDWGGKVPMIEISAKKRMNLDKLLEIIHIQSEIMELKANPDRDGQGIIVEAKKDPKKGILATIICTKGTIKIGDPFIAGTSYGKVRALINDRGERIENILPSFPAELMGLSGDVPTAGDIFRVLASEKIARNIVETRKIHKKQEDLIHQKSVSLLSLKSQVDQKMLKTLNIILKADVYGSMQAIRDSLEKLSNPEVVIHVLHSGIGNVTESDIMLAKASTAIVFGFNVDADDEIKREADKAGVEIRTYKIIYDLLEELKAAMSGLLEPEIVETVTGKAEIKQIFDLSSGKVAGSIMREGKITRGELVKLLRDGEEVASGRVTGLKRFKDDVKEVEKGFECGILVDGFKDFQIGDVLSAYVKEEKLRRLNV
ncbi:MAG: translation initiation factor IF-2 [Elusimicrobia bacterium CG08_land_8_20_14_0_20_51_18]|nr:MAG: translation initiation factor IF-2 [Elusimicrobia bacterium CG08_land_8_20_14_0_20_51_18]